MAFGPSTDLFQIALRTLLQGRQPSPLAPVPPAPAQDSGPLSPDAAAALRALAAAHAPAVRAGLPIPPAPVGDLGPLNLETPRAFEALNPEPVPPQFAQPAQPDMGFVSQYAGAEPTPPAPLSLAQRIMNAIGGFGAGYRGQGAEYLESLRAQQREYEAKRERYEGRRTAGIELAERWAEREADRINRAAELAYDRDFKVWQQKLGIRQNEVDERTRQAFEIYKLDRQLKQEEARERQRERREREDEARHISDQFFSLTKNKNLSDEIGRYRAGLSDKPLSAAATALYDKVTRLGEVQMGRALSAGSGGGRGAGNSALKAVREVEASKGELINFLQRAGNIEDAKARMREERRIRSRIGRAVGNLRRFPGQAQGGLDSQGFPWAKYWNGQQFVGIVPDSSAPAPAQPQGQMTFDLNEPQAPQLNQQQQDLFNRIKQQTGKPDEQIYTYMREKGWLQ